MTFKQALDYIHSVNWVFCKPGLERIRALCHALGDPQDRLKFIHVAGTNGKGSFCAMTDSILRAQGLRTGLFTSPYILHFTERIRVNGENIPEQALCRLVERVRPIADAMEDKPTEFELITALAFLYFEQQACDVVILECGLGGRLDATNVITTPLLSVITGIALDHTAILGDTVEQIAAEKAGIIKPGVPVLWCGEDESAAAVIAQTAQGCGVPFHKADHTRLLVKQMTLDGTWFDFAPYTSLHLRLLGTYQPQNAANVLCALALLRQNGFSTDEQAVRRGLSEVTWPARFEVLRRDPLILADGGHNPQGVDSAVDSIRQYFDGRVVLLTGVMADKDYPYMTRKMASVAAHAFCLTPDNPRALKAQKLAACFETLGVRATACDSTSSAVALATAFAKEHSLPLVCLGSLYMYADVLHALQ